MQIKFYFNCLKSFKSVKNNHKKIEKHVYIGINKKIEHSFQKENANFKPNNNNEIHVFPYKRSKSIYKMLGNKCLMEGNVNK